MKTNLILLIILFHISFISRSQISEFKVLCQSGANFVNDKELLTGASLYTNDELKIGKNSFIGLLHKSGKTLEIRKEGVYTTKNLSISIPSKNKTVYTKYLDFVKNELEKNNTFNAKNKLLKSMPVVGSVDRDINKLLLCLPDDKPEIDIVSNLFTIDWKPTKDKTIYLIHVVDAHEDEIKTFTTTNSSISIDVTSIPLGSENEFYIKIHEKNKKDKHSVQHRKIVFHKSCALNDSLAEINKNLLEETSINYYLKGHFYEEHKFFPEALNAYRKAYNLNKNVKMYKESLNNLLIENKLYSFLID